MLAPNLARPLPAASPGAPTRPARGMSGFWIQQVYIGFRLFVHLGKRSGDVSTVLLESARKDCSLGEQFCWRTLLPDSAPPLRRAPRRDPPVVCSGFGIDRLMRAKNILMTVQKILMYFPKNTADNLKFNVELANVDLEVVDKLVEVQKDFQKRVR